MNAHPHGVRSAGGAPALLTAASAYGTLAAARCLGRRGVEVTVAESRWLAPGRWSRFVREVVPAPEVDSPAVLLRWLERFGEARPGHVLYPTTDDMAWLVALHRRELASCYRLFSPGVEAVYALLDKRRLSKEAGAVGLATPRTWFPPDEAALPAVAREARFPVLVKPTTQVLFQSHCKGLRANDADSLRARYREFRQRNRYAPELLRFDPSAASPMVQELHGEAAQGIYSLSGFADHSGALRVARAAVKVLQRPRKLGIGLCFEEAPVRRDLVAGLEALCQRVGYFGVLEAEFILATGGGCLLIDFNPRLYSQMAFDIDRGVPLPYLAYLAALEDELGLERELGAASALPELQGRVYSHRVLLEVMLRGQSLSGRLEAGEAERWRAWWSGHRCRTDAVAQPDDALPVLADVAQHLLGYARHPRAFVRSMVLDR